MVALSVLDQSPVPSGTSPARALADTVALAEEAERLGYRRFWLAEHHNTVSLAGTAPEITAAYVAARTTSIRVGAGGILLSHYRPLKVAEVFRTLEALFPGRIDLGVGRASGTDALAAEALQPEGRAVGEDDYPDRVADLVAYLDGTVGPDHRLSGVRAMPAGQGATPVWVLGSSSYGAGLAARLGLPFSYAHFVSPKFGPQVMAAYRRAFRPSPRCPEPTANVAVTVVCAETEAEAQQLVTSMDVWHLRPEGAARGPLLSVADAEAYPINTLGREIITQQRDRRVVGDPVQVRSVLVAIAEAYGVDELVVRTVVHDPDRRLRSYRLLAEAFADCAP